MITEMFWGGDYPFKFQYFNNHAISTSEYLEVSRFFSPHVDVDPGQNEKTSC